MSLIEKYREMEVLEEIINNVKATFNTKQGKVTLGIIMAECGFLRDDITSEQDIGKRNFCNTLFRYMGVDDDLRSGEVVEAMTDALLNLPTKIKKEEK